MAFWKIACGLGICLLAGLAGWAAGGYFGRSRSPEPLIDPTTGAPSGRRLIRAFPGSNHESCGADTLYFCAKVRGAPLSLRQLDEVLPSSGHGASLAKLAEAARVNGAEAELVYTDLAQLERWQAPAVLHVNGSHFIALAGTTDAGRLVLFDNAFGLVECDHEWFAARYKWAGEALVLGPVPSFWREALVSPWFLGAGAAAVVLLLSGLAVWSPRPPAIRVQGGSSCDTPRDGE